MSIGFEPYGKYLKAAHLAVLLADMPDVDMDPEDVKKMQPHDLYEWLEACGYEWNGQEWGPYQS